MAILKDLFESQPLHTASDYLRAARLIEEKASELEREQHPRPRVALLTSFTTKGYREILTVEGARAGFWPNVYQCEYGQYAQDILNPASAFYEFAPDIVIIFLDTQTMLGEQYWQPYAVSAQAREERIKEVSQEIHRYVETILAQTGATVIVHNLATPVYSPLGILEEKQAGGYIESIETFNRALRDYYRSNERVFVFDYDRFCARIGKDRIRNEAMYYLGDFRLALEHAPALAREYLRYIKAGLGLAPKKCIVLDLDRTLWGGVVGEDGFDGIALGPTREGRPFWEFQKKLLALFQRGIILAINSKNNFDDAIRVIREHPHMVLREEHFAAMAINWNDKATNMKALAEELDLGLDSIVFFDDEPMNRDLVRSFLGEVTVVDLPADPSYYVGTLENLHLFESLRLTDEDKRRGQMYAAQRERKNFAAAVTTLGEYLQGLEMKAAIRLADDFSLSRIAQLTQRTNQWNMTTRRYREADLRAVLSAGALVVSISVSDRFGDNGTVGAAIVKPGADAWQIDTFLMSCRVIGRGIEQLLLWFILVEAKRAGARVVRAEFIPTKKNAVAKDFYSEQKFAKIGAGLWEYDLARNFAPPDYIEIIS